MGFAARGEKKQMKVFFSLLVTFPMIWVLVSLYIPSGSTIGRMASPFTVSLIEGGEIRLKDLRNKVVLLNFWASWCVHCQGEAKGLEAVWRKYKNKDILFLGLNVQNDDEKDARQYLTKFGITYPNGWDDGSLSQKYNVWGIPKTFIVGPKGTITYVHLGATSPAHLTAKIAEAQKGVVTAQEGRGPYESLNVVRIEELAKLLEGARGTDKQTSQQPPAQDEYRQIDIHTISSHRDQWVKILLKDGTKREGRVIDVKGDVIQLEQRFSAGSFSIRVHMGQIGEVRLLIPGSRAANGNR